MKCGQCEYVRKFHNDKERFCSSACATIFETTIPLPEPIGQRYQIRTSFNGPYVWVLTSDMRQISDPYYDPVNKKEDVFSLKQLLAYGKACRKSANEH